MTASPARYSTVAIVLHWMIAAILVVQLVIGWRLDEFEGVQRATILGLHKSIGICILVLTAFRLAWRKKRPPPPDDLIANAFERLAAKWVHRGFYVLLLLLPLTGWAMVSFRRSATLKLFGTIPWPHFPLMASIPPSLQDAAIDLLNNTHRMAAWVTVALVTLHVAGALKHHFVSKDHVMTRMLPGARTGPIYQPHLLVVGLTVLLLGSLSYWITPAAAAPRAKAANVMSADIYLDLVKPALDRRCAACHDEEMGRGGLSLATYEEMLQEGNHGRGVVPGSPLKSGVIERVLLPAEDPKYMPKGGRPALTAAQVDALRWWISIGAPRSGTIESLSPPPSTLAQLADAMGISNTGVAALAIEILPEVSPGDTAAVAELRESGFTVRKVDAQSNLLAINLFRARQLDEKDLARLGKLREQIRTLQIAGASVGDDHLGVVGQMTNLASLRVELNPITDKGIENLGNLRNLRYLNAYGTRITDAALPQLAKMPKLQKLYVWKTGITKAQVARLASANPSLIVTLDSSLETQQSDAASDRRAKRS